MSLIHAVLLAKSTSHYETEISYVQRKKQQQYTEKAFTNFQFIYCL